MQSSKFEVGQQVILDNSFHQNLKGMEFTVIDKHYGNWDCLDGTKNYQMGCWGYLLDTPTEKGVYWSENDLLPVPPIEWKISSFDQLMENLQTSTKTSHCK